jgi:DNA-directed RNA polymerase III subunit RPC2
LRLRGLVKQHIDSFNFFINHEIKKIVMVNGSMTSNAAGPDIDFYFKFTDIKIGMPIVSEDRVAEKIFPQECRIRDMTYACPMHVSIKYTNDRHIAQVNEVLLGYMPMMLGASNCWLSGKSNEEKADFGECPYDPTGYFIIKGVEKAILIQEQLAKNRIIVEMDPKTHNLCSRVTSQTYEKKSRTTVLLKHGKFYLNHNMFDKDVPIYTAFKAMGMECD